MAELGIALSVHAPWAWALMFGGKDVENRGPKFPRRRAGREMLGRVWIQASLWPGQGPLRDFSDAKSKFVAEGQRMVETMWESQGWLDESYDIRDTECLAKLYVATKERLGVSVPKTSELSNLRGHIVGSIEVYGYADSSGSPWYVPGSLAILVRHPRPIATPVPAKGALGWWRPEESVLAACREAA